LSPFHLRRSWPPRCPADLHGLELRDKQSRYHAACLKRLRLRLQQAGAESAPACPRRGNGRTWAGRSFQGWVSVPAIRRFPARSTSPTRSSCRARDGSAAGATLARLVSNVRAFNEGGSSVPRDVSLGQAAVGPCIDFYAAAPIRRPGRDASASLSFRCGSPSSRRIASRFCATRPNLAAARAFMALWCFRKRDKKLWYQRAARRGGPVEYDLERLPVMPKNL